MSLNILAQNQSKQVAATKEKCDTSAELVNLFSATDTLHVLYAIVSLAEFESILPAKLKSVKGFFDRRMALYSLSSDEKENMICRIQEMGSKIEVVKHINLISNWCNSSLVLFNSWQYVSSSNQGILYEIDSLKPIIERYVQLKPVLINGVYVSESLEELSTGIVTDINFSICNYVARLSFKERMKIYEEYYHVLGQR